MCVYNNTIVYNNISYNGVVNNINEAIERRIPLTVTQIQVNFRNYTSGNVTNATKLFSFKCFEYVRERFSHCSPEIQFIEA